MAMTSVGSAPARATEDHTHEQRTIADKNSPLRFIFDLSLWIDEWAKACTGASLGPDGFQLILTVKLLDCVREPDVPVTIKVAD